MEILEHHIEFKDEAAIQACFGYMLSIGMKEAVDRGGYGFIRELENQVHYERYDEPVKEIFQLQEQIFLVFKRFPEAAVMMVGNDKLGDLAVKALE